MFKSILNWVGQICAQLDTSRRGTSTPLPNKHRSFFFACGPEGKVVVYWPPQRNNGTRQDNRIDHRFGQTPMARVRIVHVENGKRSWEKPSRSSKE
jgi:hypothetical protein